MGQFCAAVRDSKFKLKALQPDFRGAVCLFVFFVLSLHFYAWRERSYYSSGTAGDKRCAKPSRIGFAPNQAVQFPVVLLKNQAVGFCYGVFILVNGSFHAEDHIYFVLKSLAGTLTKLTKFE